MTNIGNEAFSNCSSLTSITIPNSVTSIGEGTFSYCRSLISITIPDSVTNIGNEAFSDCSSLTSITIPNSVTSIGDWAFSNCSSLISITMPNSVTSIGEGTFSNCSSLISITIPDSVTNIGNKAFNNCSSLIRITIPNSVTSIGDWAFSYCSSLISITMLNSVTNIGNKAFNNCSSLISITIPNSVTSIAEGTFYYCSSLISITIPDSVTSIGNEAFNNCSSLIRITIPNSVISIGDWAFSDCSNLSEAYFYGDVPSIGNGVFNRTKSNFTVYYLTEKTGFTNPWYGYPTATFKDMIRPTVGNFDKKTSAQADIPVTVTLNGDTLSSITNGATPLNVGTDYTVNGDVISINKGYLATQPVGIITLSFKFSGGAAQTLTLIVSDSRTPITDLSATPGNGQVNLTFTAPTGASSVSLMQKNGQFYTQNTSVSLNANSTGTTITGLSNGTVYTFRIVVLGGTFEGNSNEVTLIPTAFINESNPLDNWYWRNPLPQGNTLSGVTYGNNIFVAVGGGTILTSAEGISWTSRTSGKKNYVSRVTYGNNIFVAVGSGGTILTSSDGITWTSRTQSFHDNLIGVTYGNNSFMAVGEYGKIHTSTDGITWTSQYGPMWLTGVTYGNNSFVAVSSDSGKIVTSGDGITWTSRTSGTTRWLKGVTYANNSFVAVGEYGTIVTSADGTSWTSQTSSTTESLVEVSYGNSTFLAVGDNGTILTSSDGTSWTKRSSGTTKSLLGVTFEKNRFVVVGVDGSILTSTDGTSWTNQTTGLLGGFIDVTYGNNIYVALGNGSITTSVDGTNWTSRATGTTKSLHRVTYGHNIFVAVGGEGTILTSSDGITWTSQTSGISSDLYGITYANNTFVAVGGYATLTSSDGITWTSQSKDVVLSEVTYGNNTFVAVGYEGDLLTSIDGVTWTKQLAPIIRLTGVTYGNYAFVAVGWYGEILRSTDGLIWTKLSLDTYYNLNDVTYGNNNFVAVGSYEGGAILTSLDGITWSKREAPTGLELTGVTYGNNSFVAVGYNGTILQTDIVTPPLTITTTNLAPAIIGSAYNVTMSVSGGASPYTWSATGLPTGLNIDSSTGVISGTPGIEGTFTINITVTDKTLQSSSTSLSLTLNPTNVVVTDVSLNKFSTTITKDQTEQLTATITPDDVTDKSVTWSVYSQSGNYIVTVSDTGLVTAVNQGTAVIRATSNADPSKYAECSVTVIAALDTTPPQFVAEYPKINEATLSGNSMDLLIETNENGMAYYVMIKANDVQSLGTMTAEDVKTWVGADHPGLSYWSGSIGLNANIIATRTISHLSSSTPYKLYLVAKDLSGNLSEVRTIDVTTTENNIPPLLIAISNATTLLGNLTVGITVGKVSQEAHDAYDTEITNAIKVRDNVTATQAEVDQAIATLNQATNNFLNSIITGVIATPAVVTENPNFTQAVTLEINGTGDFTNNLSPSDIILGGDFANLNVSLVNRDSNKTYVASVTLIGNLTRVNGNGSITVSSNGWSGTHPLTVSIPVTTAGVSAGFRATPIVKIGINPNDGDSAGIFIGLKDITDTQGNLIPNANLTGYQIDINYDHSQAKVLDVISMVYSGYFIFNNVTNPNVTSVADVVYQGTSNFEKLFFVPLALTGTSTNSTNVIIKFNSLRDQNLNLISIPDVTLTFQRGKIVNEASNRTLSIADAIAGLQFLAKSRDIGLNPGEVNVINMASILPSEPGATNIRPSVKDVIALLQKLVGLRNDNFLLLDVASATEAVVKAESTVSQLDVDSARSIVNNLTDLNAKDALSTRLDTVQVKVLVAALPIKADLVIVDF